MSTHDGPLGAGIAWLCCGLALVAGCDEGARSASATEAAAVAVTATNALGCMRLVDCLNDAGSDSAAQHCWATGSSDGRAKLQTLVDCIRDACADTHPDAGTGGDGPCASTSQCNYCVQSGTSPTGRDGGACIDDAAAVTRAADAKCGRCVDALLACD